MSRNCYARITPIALLVSLLLPASVATAFPRIEAEKGKQYRLMKGHGPWMIMVANFRDIPKTRVEIENGRAIRVKNERYREGHSAQEAADNLVHELRLEGIPAYTFSQSDVPDEVDTVDRFGRQRSATILAQNGRICVLAGNYQSTEDKIAQRTLNHIKTKFKPKYLEGKDAVNKRKKFAGIFREELKNGGVFVRTPGKPSPLAGAFLTINPLLTPEEAASRNRDPLLRKLNAGGKYNLLDNPGRFTLVVATSYVKSNVTKDSNQFEKALKNFQLSNDLDETMTTAWQLAHTLREGKVPFRPGGGQTDGQVPFSVTGQGVAQQNFEAYVFHDRYGSIVTVGSFNSVNDPAIEKYKKIFGAKVRKNLQTGQNVLIAEVMTLPDPKNNGRTLRSWIFDPSPRLIEVPDLR